MKTKYPGITAGSYGEQAIEIVIAEKSITGPELAARLGITTYDMGNLKRAVQLGYLNKQRFSGLANINGGAYPVRSNVNVYTPGERLPVSPSDKPLVHILLEHIAAAGSMTSLMLAQAADIDTSDVSSLLSHAVAKKVVKKRMTPAQVNAKNKMVCEYYDADLPRYLENFARTSGGRCSAKAATPAPEQKPANIVPPRTPPEFRPLNLARLGSVPQRDGAWDFRSIPSLYAGKSCA